MLEFVELVLFKSGEKFIGIDSNEIIKVIDFGKKDSNELAKENDTTVLYADALLGVKAQTDYFSTLIIKNCKNKKFILNIGTLEEIITIPDIKIMPIPEFVKNRQDPFIVWGFFEKNEDLVMLLTFDYYNFSDN